MAIFKTEIMVKNDADGYDTLLPKTTYDMVRTNDGSKLSDVRINGKELKGNIEIKTTTEAPPVNHASNTTQYGAGTASQYGHIKLSDNYSSSVGGAGNSLGASQSALYNAYNSLNNKIADLSTGKFLPISGGTLTGDLRLKNSSSNYGRKLNFGDGDYVYLHEKTDDNLDIKAGTIDLLCTNLYQNGKPIGGGLEVKNVKKISDSQRINISTNNQTGIPFNSSALLNSWKLEISCELESSDSLRNIAVSGSYGNLISNIYNNNYSNRVKTFGVSLTYLSLTNVSQIFNNNGAKGILTISPYNNRQTPDDFYYSSMIYFENDIDIHTGIYLRIDTSSNQNVDVRADIMGLQYY